MILYLLWAVAVGLFGYASVLKSDRWYLFADSDGSFEFVLSLLHFNALLKSMPDN